MPAAKQKKLRFAIIGSETLRGKEIKSVLGVKRFPLESLEFYDPDVAEEFSKLTQFHDEPKVVHHLDPKALAGLDLVFLAADVGTNTTYGEMAASLGYRAIDLMETFNTRDDVPIVVAGLNDAVLKGKKFPVIANPNPVTIMLAHLLQALRPSFGIAKALAFVLEPVSAYEEKGIQELAEQSYALLGGANVSKKVFRDQVAFNLLSQTEKPASDGFSSRERRILAEVRRVIEPGGFPLSLSVVLAPVFHTYSIMTYVELEKDASVAALERCFRGNSFFKLAASGVSSVSAAGKDKIFVGPIKKEDGPPRGFWIWSVADNLTLGSALNAYEIARSLFGMS